MRVDEDNGRSVGIGCLVSDSTLEVDALGEGGGTKISGNNRKGRSIREKFDLH